MSTLNVVNIVTSNISDGTTTIGITSTSKGSAKAWVNFNGTGSVAIRASYNVSSITDLGVGKYTVNYTTPVSTNSCVVYSNNGPVTSTSPLHHVTPYVVNITTTSVELFTYWIENSSVGADPPINCVIVCSN